MAKFKNDIIKLRQEGKSYKEISKILNCSQSLVGYYVYYYLGTPEQKERLLQQKKKSRKYDNKNKINKKIQAFCMTNAKQCKTKKQNSNEKLLRSKIEHFSRKVQMKYEKPNFNFQDVINKFGENTKCYLTGVDINLNEPRTYEFDHIIPRSRGGQNTIDNLGICTKKANQSKRNMTPDEYIDLCKQVLLNNGYRIEKI